MNRAQRIIQAYKNTPWRRQLGMFSSVVTAGLVLVLVGFAYTYLTSYGGTYGLQVQEYQTTNQYLDNEIENAKADLADITGSVPLATRAADLGYVPAQSNELRYIVVSNYPANPTPAVFAEGPHQAEGQTTHLPPEFTTSLIDWLRAFIYDLSLKTGAADVGGN